MSDLIERQAVLDAMYALCNTGETLKDNPWRDNPHIDAIIGIINNLPSAEKTGHLESVLEDIKAEIYKHHPIKRGDNDYANGAYDGMCRMIDLALDIIDKHMRGTENG